MPAIEQVALDRKELIRANLRLRDQNEDLRYGLELLERRIPALEKRTTFAEERWRFWRLLCIWAIAGFLFAVILLLSGVVR
jgi:hypothetical protein